MTIILELKIIWKHHHLYFSSALGSSHSLSGSKLEPATIVRSQAIWSQSHNNSLAPLIYSLAHVASGSEPSHGANTGWKSQEPGHVWSGRSGQALSRLQFCAHVCRTLTIIWGKANKKKRHTEVGSASAWVDAAIRWVIDSLAFVTLHPLCIFWCIDEFKWRQVHVIMPYDASAWSFQVFEAALECKTYLCVMHHVWYIIFLPSW